MPLMRSHNTVIVFTKAPQICRVKTRMWPAYTFRQCRYIHEQLTRQILHTLTKLHSARTVIYTSGSFPAGFIPANFPVKRQFGSDLGLRMYNAIRLELKTAMRVVLIGTDCSQMNTQYIDAAFSKLKSTQDIVLGPAYDGGFVLIGARGNYPNLFRNIVWGTSNVFASTASNIRKAGLRLHTLDVLPDVDNKNDLELLQLKNILPGWAHTLVNVP